MCNAVFFGGPTLRGKAQSLLFGCEGKLGSIWTDSHNRFDRGACCVSVDVAGCVGLGLWHWRVSGFSWNATKTSAGKNTQHSGFCFLFFCPCQIMQVFSGRMCCECGWWEDVSACIMLRPLAPQQSGSREPSSLNAGTLQSKGLTQSNANTGLSN